MTTRLFFTVEGLALPIPASTSSRMYRFSTGPFSGDTDGAYVACIPAGQFPDEVASQINPRDSTRSTGGMSLECAALPAVVAAFMDGRQIARGALTSDLTRTATTMDTDVDDGSLTGALLLNEREVLMVGGHLGSGTYTIARGQAGTTPEPHSADNTSGYPILLDASTFPVSRQRRVTLGRVVDDGAQSGYSAEETLWVGVLDGVSMMGSVIRIDASPVWTVFDDAQICASLWSGTPSASALKFVSRDARTPVGTSNNVTIQCEKLTIMRRCRYISSADQTLLTLSSLPVGEHPIPTREDLEKLSRVNELHHCNGTSTSGYPLSRNAITLCLQVLTTTAHGQNFDPSNTSYDLGVEDLGVGLPYDLVDVDGFESVRASLGDLAIHESLYLGLDGKAVQVKELFARLLRPLGCTLAQNLSGQITCVRLRDSTDNPAAVLDSSNILTNPDSGGAYPTHTPRLDLAYDSLDVEWDWRLSGARSDTYQHAFKLRQTLDPLGSSMDMGHHVDASRVRTLAVYNITRYSRAMPQIDLSVLRSVDVALGDLVTLSLPSIGIRGRRGVKELVCLVVARRLVLDEGILRLRLWGVGEIYDRTGVIAPSAKISAWDSGTNTYTLEPNAFSTGSVDDYPTDTAGFEVGDHIDLCARSYGVRNSDQTITAIGENTITVAVAPKTTPNVGDILRLATYEDQDEDGLAPWAWLWSDALTWTPYNWTS